MDTRTDCYHREPGFVLQLCATLFWELGAPFLTSTGTSHAHGTHTYLKGKHINIILKFFTNVYQLGGGGGGGADGVLILRPASSTEPVPGQQGLHKETLSWKSKKLYPFLINIIKP